MDKNKKNIVRNLVLTALVVFDYFILSRLWALIVLLIACVPARENWHIYCLAIGVPILMIGLAWRIERAIKRDGGRFYCDIKVDIISAEVEDTEPESHE